MFDFFLILFFSKTLLLTPIPVDIEKTYTLNLEKPISAITSGASIQLDVSDMLLLENSNILEIRNRVSDIFFKDSIDVEISLMDEKIKMIFDGATLINNDSVRLILHSSDDVLDKDFNKIIINTKIKLENIKVYWKNYKK